MFIGEPSPLAISYDVEKNYSPSCHPGRSEGSPSYEVHSIQTDG